ncbi:hypothetical protein KKD95_02195 [Patescibacteria group bacterium]|nr:hypothetical protein [Patescibacteria group bacterium]
MNTEEQTMTINSHSLKEHGVMNAVYPAQIRSGVLEIQRACEAFYSLPLEVKRLLPYQQFDAESGAGYEYKDNKNQPGISPSTRDFKENLHLKMKYLGWLREKAGASNEPVIVELVEAYASFMGHLAPWVSEIATAIEEQHGIPGLARDVLANQDLWVLRSLHYFGDRNADAELAKPHTDKCCFTPHLYENDSGLERLTYENAWVPMPVGEGETAIIPGMQLQNISDNELRATWHRVKANEHTAVAGRFSMVCFVTAANRPFIDSARAGRMQDLGVGSTYRLPLEEVRKLFKTSE